MFLGAVVGFLLWFRRSRLNAEFLAPGSWRYSAGFAVGAWFVPLVMWWIPRRIALDIWRASPPATGAWVVDAWWAAWVGNAFCTVLAQQFGERFYGYTLLGQAGYVAAAVLVVVMIRQVSARQEAAFRASRPVAV
ncbi:DUF4328 domain-containing protein [Kitasatospora sp. NPDC057198]|uniref:DUF4328 domain-containing protein n=1 Tax=Kitasatospora sp. NPDC057198 TaxID=3346046 RepID=UPI00362A9226